MICLLLSYRCSQSFDLVSTLPLTEAHASYFNQERPFHSPSPSSSSQQLSLCFSLQLKLTAEI